MDLGQRLESLLAAAEEMGITVRAEPMGGAGGGLCTLHGRRVLFVDLSADLTTRYERTLAALAPLPQIDDHFMPPLVRLDLEKQRGPAR